MGVDKKLDQLRVIERTLKELRTKEMRGFKD